MPSTLSAFPHPPSPSPPVRKAGIPNESSVEPLVGRPRSICDGGALSARPHQAPDEAGTPRLPYAIPLAQYLALRSIPLDWVQSPGSQMQLGYIYV